MAQLFEPVKPWPVPLPKRITDFEEFDQLFMKWDGRFEQLSCGKFEGAMLVSRGAQLAAMAATTNQVLTVRGRDVPGLLHFLLVLPEAARSHFQKSRLEVGSIVVRDERVPMDHRTCKLAAYLGLRAEEETIRAVALAYQLSDLRHPGWFALKTPPDEFSRLENGLRRFLIAAQDPAFVGTQVARQLEQFCLATAITATFPAQPRRRVDVPYSSRVKLVHKAEAIMRARVGTPTGEIDLCIALGVSGRTLRQAFREQYCMGPMAYFQAVRLNAARAALKTASDLEPGTVNSIAQMVGFNHPGKFAGYYRRLFGELPSQTIPANRRVEPAPTEPTAKPQPGVARRH